MPSPYDGREQTEVKHRILERYLEAFIPIVGAWAPDISYIDCCAGPWDSADPNLSDTSFARAIEVIRATKRVLAERGKNPAIRCLLIEKETSAFKRLEQYCDGIKDVDIRVENWDFTERISDIAQFAKVRGRDSFPFIFIDPKGWEQLEIRLVTPLFQLNPGEMLINLMTSWITRFLSVESKGWDRLGLVGDDLANLVALKGEEKEDQLVRSYASIVRRTGMFGYVCSMPVMKAGQDAFHYYMIYATRNAKGVEVFKDTERAVIPFMHEIRANAQERKRLAKTGQNALFNAAALYRESRFSRFQQKNLELAKNEVCSLLKGKPSVPYDDAWLTAMQFSAVTEQDLREWIDEWCTQRDLTVLNKTPTQRVLVRARGHILKWRGPKPDVPPVRK